MMHKRRFIEETFPVKEVSAASRKEKNIRLGNISTLHVWWARRPLAASRTTIYGSLIPVQNETQTETHTKLISKLSKWETIDNERILNQARNHILESNDGSPPRVLDPFAGGGSIPLEALRLGCETYSCDLNPVAVLIQKSILEFPQQFGRNKQLGESILETSENTMIDDISKWSNYVLENCMADVGSFYPIDEDGKIPVAYIWARTISCQNPSCQAEIPLFRQFWLSRKKKKKVALFPFVVNDSVAFKIVGDGYSRFPANFDASKGTVQRAVVTCPVCHSTIDAKTTRKLFSEGKTKERMIAVVLKNPSKSGKLYRLASSFDVGVFESTKRALDELEPVLSKKWGLSAIPDEELPPKETLGFRVQRYGILNWGQLFNKRQSLSIITFVSKIRDAYEKMIEEGYKKEYAKAVVTYLSLALDMSAAFANTLARWENTSEAIKQLFGRQTLSMMWDYAEVNPFGKSSGSYETGWRYYLAVIIQCMKSSDRPAIIRNASATSLPFQDNLFDAVFTDPPYYDNVPYAYLSDFFYVWLKRSIGYLYPELFSTPLTPKKNEIVAYPHKQGGEEGSKLYFEAMLSVAFTEIFRVLKPGGIAVIVYAHKSTKGWETLINSLLDSGLIVTGAWPLHTEMVGRLRSIESAALASSIYIVARKMQRNPTGIYKDVARELQSHLGKKLNRLWKDGVSGADFFIAAIGSAIEVFGKYESVIDFEGNQIRAEKLLDDVRNISTNFAVERILHNGFSDDVSNLTRYYLLFRWNYQSTKVKFDEARKLAQSCGIDLAKHWSGTGFIKKEKEFIRVLGPQDRKLDELEDKTELIDVLHKSLLLWSKNRRDEIPELLAEANLNRSETFWRVAQAVSETLSIQDKEKKLLDGFLTGKNGYTDREPHEQVTVAGTPVKAGEKKRRRKQAQTRDTQDEYKQVELE